MINLPTDYEVECYMRAKFAELREHCAYADLTIEINGSDNPKFQCAAYINQAIGTVFGKTLTEAIAAAITAKSNKTESELLRERAAEMLAKADQLEGVS